MRHLPDTCGVIVSMRVAMILGSRYAVIKENKAKCQIIVQASLLLRYLWEIPYRVCIDVRYVGYLRNLL
jgi:hypothetical protein